MRSTRTPTSGLLWRRPLLAFLLVGLTLLVPVSPPSLASPEDATPVRDLAASLPRKPDEWAKRRVRMALEGVPLSFVENRGQMDGRVAYYVDGRDRRVGFTPQGLNFVLSGGGARHGLELEFVGASAGVRPEGEVPTATVYSYFRGQPSRWRTGLRSFRRLVYRELWPGIDLVYEGTVSRMKYNFVVRPGADPRQIRLAWHGANAVTISGDGELEVETPVGGLTDERPVSFQHQGAGQDVIATAYRIEPASDSTRSRSGVVYGFAVGEYDRSRELVVDPAMLVYAGYIGGDGRDDSDDIAVDGEGNVYVTGSTQSTETTFPDGDGFGTLIGADTTRNDSINDVFVVKVNAEGTALVYATYIGGSGSSTASGIAVDGAGNCYVAGLTNSDQMTFPDGDGFGATPGPDRTHNGSFDGFVAKIDATGTALVYAGYIGGNGDDFAFDIAVDGAGNAYVAGVTSSTQGFPGGTGFGSLVGVDRTFNGSQDGFVVKINAEGTALVYATFIGGSGLDSCRGIAVDDAGNAYVTGATESTATTFPDGDGFGSLVGADGTHNGSQDGFVTKINAEGTALVYATYIGGSGFDKGSCIAVDGAGSAYVGGDTPSSESSFPDGDGFGALVGADKTFNGFFDGFVAKIDPPGTALVYTTYIGGIGVDACFDIAVNRMGNAYVTGQTSSGESDFPDGDGFGTLTGPDTTFNGLLDGFVAKLDPAGAALVFVGYLGGPEFDECFGLALDESGSVHVAGRTASSPTDEFPAVGPDLTFNGGPSDAFVAKIVEVEPGPEITSAVHVGKTLTIEGERFVEPLRVIVNDVDKTSRIKTASSTVITLKGKAKKLGLKPGDNTVQVIGDNGESNVFVLRR